MGGTTLVPSVSMMLGTCAISMAAPSDHVEAMFQHLSAGLLIGAVVTDIFPLLKDRMMTVEADGTSTVVWMKVLAAAGGFVLAMMLMYGLKLLDLEADEVSDDDSEGNAKGPSVPLLLDVGAEADLEGPKPLDDGKLQAALTRLAEQSGRLTQIVSASEISREEVDKEIHSIEYMLDSARRLIRNPGDIDEHNAERLRFHVSELADDISKLEKIGTDEKAALETALQRAGKTLHHIHDHAARSRFRRWGAKKTVPVCADQNSVARTDSEIDSKEKRKVAGPIPWSLALAVVIDSIVDGMLIGLASAVCRESGMLMATATTIEMGFLGYSFACSVLRKVKRGCGLLILAVPPAMMVVASLVAAFCTDSLKGSGAFVALIAFAMVALLYLVVQELLVEAHEKEGGSFQTSVWLYVGLAISIATDLFLA